MTTPVNDKDPIAESLEAENEYWQRVGGRDESDTNGVSFDEQWELMLKELP